MELNAEQKKAIHHTEGPLLIIAGAGTGKTRVITARILELIHAKKAKPGEILALTFTEKAANEMIGRIDLEMPLGYEELCIKTFHAFSDQILRESGLEIGIDPGYKILTDVEQWFLFKKHLFDFELDYYRPLGNPNRFVFMLLKHFSKLKDELIRPEQYSEYAAHLEGEEGEKAHEIAAVYKQYQELLIRKNCLDFGDLNFYANALLEKRKSCLEKYQNRYKYILIDEFQDTNYAQFQMVLKLAEKDKNLAVVGDDDQSIYKWRGASISNILQFEKHFPRAAKIVLTKNYRSTQSILDSAYALIKNNNPDRLEVKLGIQKKLECHSKDDRAVEIHHFPDFLHESCFVAETIKELQQKENKQFSDFAILVRTNQQTHPFIDELKALGIPYQVKNPKGLFSLEEIKDLIAVVRTVANPYDDISLLRILKMDVFDIAMSEILKLLNDKNEHLFDSCGGKLRALTDDLIDSSKKKSVGRVINEFLQKSGYLNYLIKSDKFEELENINEFAKQVGKFEKENEENSVSDFVSYLDLLEEANAVFNTEDFADRNSVQILTAHSAKGLEFEYVFIGNAVKQRFPTSKRGETFEVPQELTNEIYPEGDFHLQEERRLFYVAMTRAKGRLFIGFSDQYEGSKSWQASPFVKEVLESGKAKLIEHKAEKNFLKKLREFKEPSKPIFDLPPLKRKKLSYSQFDVFKTCPLKYNYRYLMNVPMAPFHATNFGSSVHNTLKEFYQLLKKGASADLDTLKALYDKNWIPYGYENEEHEIIRRERGFEMLSKFYENNNNPWVMPAHLERPFNLKFGDFWVSGRIDRIDKLEDGTFEVIDYKTGQNKNENLKKDLQLSIYALACRDIFGLNISRLSLYFLEQNEKVSTTRNERDLEEARLEIQNLIANMSRSDFSATPGFHCQFCDFRLICPAV